MTEYKVGQLFKWEDSEDIIMLITAIEGNEMICKIANKRDCQIRSARFIKISPLWKLC